MKRLDDILGYKDLKIFQDSDFFSFSLDSIILANYTNVRLRDKCILDFCTGNGIVPLILSQRINKKIIGIEIQNKLVNLANESIKYNNLENQIDIVNDDIKKYVLNHLNEADLVLCNPPFFKVEEKSSFNYSYEKKVARHELLINLSQICDCANKVLKDHGNISIVYRSDRLMDVLYEFRKHNLEPKAIKFIYENVNSESFIVLISGQKCGKAGLKVEKPLILYGTDGKMTEEYAKLQEEVRI